MSEKEKKILVFLENQERNKKSILLGAAVLVVTGLVATAAGLLYLGTTYIVGGLYFLTSGGYAIITNSKYREIHGMLKRLTQG